MKVTPLPGSSRWVVMPVMRPYPGTLVPIGTGRYSMPTRTMRLTWSPPHASRSCVAASASFSQASCGDPRELVADILFDVLRQLPHALIAASDERCRQD